MTHWEAAHPAPDGLRDLLPLLAEALPDVLDEATDLLRDGWPDYAEFLEQHRDEVAAAAPLALDRILTGPQQTRPAGRSPGTEAGTDLLSTVFEEIGRTQWRQGNPLAFLLSAYQTGARGAWRQISRMAVEQGVAAAELALLADGLFGFVDQLSTASAHGYAAEHSEAAAGRERARADLADLLLAGRGDHRAIDEAAYRAGFELPLTATVVLVDRDNAAALDALTRGSGDGWLPIKRTDGYGVILSDPAAPGRRRRLAELLAGSAAVVGPTVSLPKLPPSLRMTRIALRLRHEGVLTEDPVFLDEHLDAVIVHQDDRLLAALEERVLQPLAGLPAPTRRRLEETLASWLWHMGDRGAMAWELHVHRQTVRYRLAQLQELFGDAMTDPARRVQLMLALSWRPARAYSDGDREDVESRREAVPGALIDLASMEQRRSEGTEPG
jgi:hypothetical protein